nr:sn-glycerol-3-phosphate ABC transporter ATP-binding protein UgpC [Rhizobium sp. P38BS-XIX]
MKSIQKLYRSLKVIHGIDLTVNDGEFLALVGPSGCGKSTLLRMIAGLEEISAGEIAISGTVVNDLGPKQRNIAMVFQNYALYPHMTVRDNISLNLKLSNVPKAEIGKRVEEAAQLLDIKSLLDRRPAQLSGGQRQRVAMGRAIVRNPAVFLFDEPLSNLDAKLRVQMRSEIKSFHQKVKTTSIYVTHDQIEAMTLADRIVVLNAGRIEQVGTPIELYETPKNTFVASFIGSPAMNLFEATVKDGENGSLIAITGGGLSVELPRAIRTSAGNSITVGIRPEHIKLTGEGFKLPATIAHVEPTGAQSHLMIDCNGTTMTAVVDDIVRLAPGAAVNFHVNPDKIHVFSKADGTRLPSGING